MSVTARHKRPGGFRKLVIALETTIPSRRKVILDSLRSEDPDLARLAEESLFSFDDFVTVTEASLCELMDAFKNDGRTVALALYHADKGLIERFTKNMPVSTLRSYKEHSEVLTEVRDNERTSARFRVISKARELESAARIKLKPLKGNYPE